MAKKGKKSKPFDYMLLQECINEVEKDGPLSNLSQLWEKASQQYNSRKNSALPTLAPSSVMSKAKDNMDYKTKAGKKGRQKGLTGSSATTGFAIPITDWATKTITVGKGVGNETTTRWVLSLDKHCWSISLQRGDTLIGQKFGCKISHILPHVKDLCGVSAKEAAQSIVKQLKEITGIDEEIDWDGNFGEEIDKKYKTNMFRYDDVVKRICKK